MNSRISAGALLSSRIPFLIKEWRGDASSAFGGREIEAAAKALLALQRGLTGPRKLAGGGYMEDRELLGAYLLYYWPVSYMQVSLALAELPCSPGRVLDLGSGPGPAAAAIADSGSRLEEIVLVDGSRKALELGAAILAKTPGLKSSVRTVQLDLESGASLPEGPFDLIVMGHCLNELWEGEPDSLERRAELVRRAGSSLSPGGLILLVEPALLSTSRGLIGLRDRLAASGWRILAPCPGSYACPALAAGPDRSCHAESPWEPPEIVASLAKAAGLDRRSAKFTFFFLSPESRPEDPRAEAGRLDRRVVSDPMLNKAGRLRFILCGDGRLETISARADDPSARAKGFPGLRRGDVIRARALEARQGGFGLGPDSELEFRALAPEAAS
jgi:SAM-dependent methyltransferase